ncbi:hypothetical protein [Planctomicrobium sp. SH664]|uniref:hypothetical protein n=1 Tax=Planctomicrobium sp. SH664 TaxID=3448125 RepID=UPI003F5B3C6F
MRTERKFDLFAWISLCLLSLLPRLAVMQRYQQDLGDDRDYYIAIAQGIQEGRGLSIPGGTLPSAYRPPLYPLLLAAIPEPVRPQGIAVLHLTVSVLAALLVWGTARNLLLGRWESWWAAAFYCVDPLLLRYCVFPMTETVSAFLVALLMVLLTWQPRRRFSNRTRRLLQPFLAGLAFGACVLCRPTFWSFGGLYALFWVWHESRQMSENLGRRLVLGTLGVAVLVVPWLVRNWQQLGSPIFMTTHGGYTLLLGNNEAFYREVVEQPWGTIWDGSHGPGQADWFSGIEREIEAAGVDTEVERDQWMSQRAVETIRRFPETFAKACLLKWTWFWNVTGHSPTTQGVPPAVFWTIGAYYSLLWIGLLAGFGQLLRLAWRRDEQVWHWSVPVLLILSTSAVHLVYWSDARMRGPIVPAIAVVCLAWRLKRESGDRGRN